MEQTPSLAEHPTTRLCANDPPTQSNCHVLPGLANLSASSDESVLDDFTEYPTRVNTEQDYRDSVVALQPHLHRPHHSKHTRNSTSSSEPELQRMRSEISHMGRSDTNALRIDGVKRLGFKHDNRQLAMRDYRQDDEEADIRSSTSSRALSNEFMENYREYLGPEDCAVGHNSKEISIPHFISHNSQKADYILGLHITSMQALAARDSDDATDGDAPAQVGAATSGSQLTSTRPRNDSVIEQNKSPVDQPARTTEIKVKPDPRQHTPVADEFSKEVCSPFGTISCEKHPSNVARITSPKRQILSILDSREMHPKSITLGNGPSYASKHDSALTLFVARRYAHSGRLVSRIIIPAISNFPGTASETSEKHFTSLDFDDEVFLKRVQREYYGTLLGRSCFARVWRGWFSARTLKHIAIVTADSAAELAPRGRSGVPRHNGVRGSRAVAEKSLDIAFSEEELFRHFRNPKLGQTRYAWVHWAHRVAADDGPAASEQPDPDRWARRQRDEKDVSRPREYLEDALDTHPAQSLEFVEGWSPWRIITTVVIIILASVAAALLWIFLGPASPGNSWTVATIGNSQSWTDATHRVGGGLLMGGLIIIFGCILLGSWLVVSWIWMS